jgi:hypothetical protein
MITSLSAGTITGIITDNNTGKAIPGVNVWIKGTKFGAATDTSGYFFIKEVLAGQHQLQVNCIGYCPQSENITISSNSDIITVNFKLSLPSIAVIESENIKAYQDNIYDYRKPISFEIENLLIRDNRVELEISITNKTPYDLYILRSLPCFELFEVIIHNQSGDRAEPPMINLGCDVLPLQLPHKSDLFRIRANETVQYPDPITSDRILDILEKGRYIIRVEYEYKVLKSLGFIYIGTVGCNGTPDDFFEEIEVLTKILRGHFVSKNNVEFEID